MQQFSENSLDSAVSLRREETKQDGIGFYDECPDRSVSVSCALKLAVEGSGLSCSEIASGISRLIGVTVTEDRVAGWTNPDSPDGVPLGYAAALATVIGDDRFVRVANAPFRRECMMRESASEFGAGPGSEPQGHLIRAWMSANRHTTSAVADMLGVSCVAVRRFILGTMRSNRIRTWFVDQGCPSEFLGPDD